VNPAEIKVGITSLKTPRDGRILIEAASRTELNLLVDKIREVCWNTGREYAVAKKTMRPAQTSTNIVRLDTRHKHWPVRNPTQRRCRVCSARGVTRSVKFKCLKWDVALCVDKNCFIDYHRHLITSFRPSYNPETKQQSSQWKTPSFPRKGKPPTVATSKWGNMLKAINEVEGQGSDADREHVEAHLSGQIKELGNKLIEKWQGKIGSELPWTYQNTPEKNCRKRCWRTIGNHTPGPN